MDDGDRMCIVDCIRRNAKGVDTNLFVITHGTDTMIESGRFIDSKLKDSKYCIVITGAMKPAKFKQSDALFNLGSAISAVRTLSEYGHFGVFIAMNGRLLHCNDALRNRQNGFFVSSNI